MYGKYLDCNMKLLNNIDSFIFSSGDMSEKEHHRVLPDDLVHLENEIQDLLRQFQHPPTI